jgi:hypothetical protein
LDGEGTLSTYASTLSLTVSVQIRQSSNNAMQVNSCLSNRGHQIHERETPSPLRDSEDEGRSSFTGGSKAPATNSSNVSTSVSTPDMSAGLAKREEILVATPVSRKLTTPWRHVSM